MTRRKGRPPTLKKFVKFDPTSEDVNDYVDSFLKKGGRIKKIKTVDTSE